MESEGKATLGTRLYKLPVPIERDYSTTVKCTDSDDELGRYMS
jgi:hypothetical protein